MPAINVHPKPAGLSWEEAAAFPLAGLTAWRATVTCAGAAPGRRLLITGGGSGVSTCCLQIAHALGAQVWVTSGSDAKIARCVELGRRGRLPLRRSRVAARRCAPRPAARASTP